MSKVLKKRQTFALQETQASAVQLVGDFSEWEKSPITLKKQKDGVWKATLSLAPGCYQYRFLVDGDWRNDPNCNDCIPNPFGGVNCVREVA